MIFLVSTVPVISPLTACRLTACLELNIPQSMTWNNRRSTSQCRIFSYHSRHLGNEEKKRHDTLKVELRMQKGWTKKLWFCKIGLSMRI